MENVVRTVLGSVTHADGTTTSGIHVRNAVTGELEFVDLSAETIDWERWRWAWTEAHRVLRSGGDGEDA